MGNIRIPCLFHEVVYEIRREEKEEGGGGGEWEEKNYYYTGN